MVLRWAGRARPTVPARRGLRVAAGGGVLLTTVLLAGCASDGSQPPGPNPVPVPVVGATTSAAPSPAAAPAPAVAPRTAPAARTAPLTRSTPERVRVPSIGADSTLLSLGLNEDRTVEVPPVERSELAGWYRNFPTPGQKGTSVILGHINGGGKDGVFSRLQQMRPGQKVYVDRADGTEAVFTVDEVHNFDKDAFPTKRVYGQSRNAQLRLISCGGTLDRSAHSYEDNVVVFATLTGVTRA